MTLLESCLTVDSKAGRVLRGARIRYAPFSLVMEGDWKAYLEDIVVS